MQAGQNWGRFNLPAVCDKFLDAQPGIPGNMPEQDGGEVTSSMHRDGCCAAVCMPKALVRTALPNFLKAKRGEYGDDLTRLKNGNARHFALCQGNRLRARILGRQGRCAVLAKQSDHFRQIAVELLKRLGLAVRAGHAGNITYVQPRIQATLDHRSVGLDHA